MAPHLFNFFTRAVYRERVNMKMMC